MSRNTSQEVEDLKKRAAELWLKNAQWNGMPAREVCIDEELFTAYFVGTETGQIKHFGGPRAGWSEDAAHETQRSAAENLARGYAKANAQPGVDIEDLDERAQAMWDANSTYRGEKVRNEFVSATLLAAYLKALDSGARHLIRKTT